MKFTLHYNSDYNFGGPVMLRTRFLVLPLAFWTSSCGTNVPRMLESVAASPSTADAKNFPNGRVHFIPTGIYNEPPTTVTPLPVTAWSTYPNNIASIDQNGIATGLPGRVGIVKIEIAVAGDGPLMDVADLTCP